MGIFNHSRRGSGNNITGCPTSVGTIELKGSTGCLYAFCMHEIDVLDKDIDISDKLDKSRKLNEYGEGPFCIFRINDHLKDKGLYCYIVNGELKYIGETCKTYEDRINNGYGRIYARNCYKSEIIGGEQHSGGQSTNCRINSLINEELHNGNDILIGFYEMNNSSDAEIKLLESILIDKYDLVRLGWNRK
jgi:hypothetical protein